MPRKILIVDDNIINREMLKKVLSEEYEVLEAKDGSEALDLVEQNYKELSAVLTDIVMPVIDGYGLLSRIRDNSLFSQIPVIMVTGSEDERSRLKALSLGANDFILKPFNPEIVKHCIQNNIALREASTAINALRRDSLTGLYGRDTFFEKVSELVSLHEPGYYIMACFDIDRFKVINDQYGTQKGDEVLKHTADAFIEGFEPCGGLCCRIGADNFAVLYPASFRSTAKIEDIRNKASHVDGIIFPLIFSIGRYIIDDITMPPSAMYDRAALASETVKGRYDTKIAFYDETMREHLIREQQIVTEMEDALSDGQFEAWFQPQYNHSTAAMIGAEALVRWRHPMKGLIPPNDFIPVFEQNGFIYSLDKFVWEEVCRYLRKWIDEGRSPLPISVNISRYDLFSSDIVEVITGLIEKYSLPKELLRLEITESAFAESFMHIVDVVSELVEGGFTVEIDDFGSGYSSLNTLKDVPAQIIKLDMRFLESSTDSQRGGNIVESVVRMAKWLGISIIAEGVETLEQANYLRSIGCSYMQGYLYARPMPAEEYELHCSAAGKEERLLALETVENLDNNSFWDPDSMDTLIFNSYVGGACIYEYNNGNIELLRATEKYAQVITGGSDMTVEEVLKLNLGEYLDKTSKERVSAILDESVRTKKEVVGEFVFLNLPGCPRETYLRSTMRVIASAGERRLVYCTNENITAQRKAEQRERESSERLQTIMDNVDLGIIAAVYKSGTAKYLFANNRYYEMLGYTKEEFENEVYSPFNTVAPEDLERVKEEIAGIDKSGKSQTVIYNAITKDGNKRIFRAAISVAALSGVSYPVQMSIIRDITEEYEIQQSETDAAEQMRFLNNMSHELLTRTDADTGINAALGKLMQYFSGLRAYIFEFDFDKEIAENTYEVCAEGVTPEIDNLRDVPLSLMEFWFKAFDEYGYYAIQDIGALGSERAEEKARLEVQGIKSLFVVPLKRDGKLIAMIGVDDPGRELTHVDRLMALGDYIAVMLTRRDLNARIRSDNETLYNMMSDMPGGFCRMLLGKDGKLKPIFINEGLCKLTGMSLDEMMKLYAEDAMAGVHPDDLEIVNEAVSQMFEKGEARSARYRLMHSGGDYVWLMIFGRITKNVLGETYLNIYYTDATDRVKEEETLKELLDNLPCGAGIYEFKDGRMELTYQNKSYWELVGLNEADLLEAGPMSAVHPDDIGVIMRELTSAVENNRDVVCDVRLRHLSLGYRPVHLVGRIVHKSSGAFSVYATFTPNETRNVSYQQLLPLLLSAIMDSTSDMSFAKDTSFRYITASTAFANMAGRESSADIVGKTDYDIFDKKLADKFRKDDENLLESGKALIDAVELIPSADGAPRYSNTSKYVLRDGDGKIIGLYGVGRDVTKSVVQDSQLKFVNDSIPGGLAVYVCKHGDFSPENIKITYFNDGFCRLFGFSREEYEKQASSDPLSMIFDEDRHIIAGQWLSLMKDGSPINCLYRTHIKNEAGYKWISHKAVEAGRQGDNVVINAVLQDITDQRELIEQLRISEEESNLAVRLGGNIVCRYIVADKTLTILPEIAEAYGIPQTLCDVPYAQVAEGIISPESADAYTGFFESILSGSKAGTVLFQQKYFGTWRWMEAKSTTIFGDDGKPVKAVISMLEVTEKLERETVYKKWQQSLEDRLPESYMLYRCNISENSSFDSEEGSLLTIDFAPGVFNFDARTEEYAQKCVFDEDRERFIAFLKADTLLSGYYQGKRVVNIEYREITPERDIRWLKLTVDLVDSTYSSEVEAYLLFENIDEAKRAELQTKERSESDPLTGVLNRNAFSSKVEQLIKASGAETRHALLMLDIDGFKQVNDVFGHRVGDQVLIDIANGLRSIMRRNDLVARLGGDEFVVFLNDISDEKAAELKATQICALLRRSFSLEVQISVSVGIVIAPQDGVTFETLYKKVDSALYYVKGSGKDNYVFYNESMVNEHIEPEADGLDRYGLKRKEKKRRMLIVDDNVVDYAMLQNIFADEFIIEKAKEGSEALVRLRHYGSAISVVLLDLMMPGMSGFEVLEKMHSAPELQSIPVIIVSGDESRESCLKAIRKGAADFITKPVDADILRIRVQSAISKAENAKLRAQNRLLEMQNEERIRYESVMKSSGITFAEYNGLTDEFTYYPSMQKYILGNFDNRKLWQVLLSDMAADTETVRDMQALVHRVAEDENAQSESMSVKLKTPQGRIHNFRMNVHRPVNEYSLTDKLILLFNDLDYDIREESDELPK